MTALCPVCGEHVTTRTCVQGVTGWETSDGLIRDDVVVVLHPECYMRLSPDERQAVWKEAAETFTD